MTVGNAKFNGEFNDIRLKIQIGEKKKQKRHLEEKICLNYKKFHKRKFTQFEFK